MLERFHTILRQMIFFIKVRLTWEPLEVSHDFFLQNIS
jgi:hypothetical protein